MLSPGSDFTQDVYWPVCMCFRFNFFRELNPITLAMGLLGKTFMPFRKELIFKIQLITGIFITCLLFRRTSVCFTLETKAIYFKALSVELEEFFFLNP